MGEGNLDGAIAAFRKAIELYPKDDQDQDPIDAQVYYFNLGSALQAQGKLDEAIAAYRKAIAINPMHVLDRRTLTEWMADQEPHSVAGMWLPLISAGNEELGLAQLCLVKELNAAAARFYADAFAAQPTLTDNLSSEHRYYAARSAALASCGQGKDANELDAKERTRLRAQALDWLRKDLQANAQIVEGGKLAAQQEVRQRLMHWQNDPDLACVRDRQALDRLPANERTAWQELWREVDKLLTRVVKKAN
jgi:tetratricopeptide (TPR) repeat protein